MTGRRPSSSPGAAPASTGDGDGPVRVLINPAARAHVPGGAPGRDALRIHQRLPEYSPTPLTRCPHLARSLGVAEVWVKDETWRLGLPAFKMLGASYAVCRALTERLGREARWDNIGDLRRELAPLGRLTLAAPTDGNHGRAVARMARLLGQAAAIYVPEGTAAARIHAIEGEGARVIVVPGGYNAAVARCARDASDDCLIISDTSWAGYTRVPRWVVAGYSTIFAEITDQVGARGAASPDVVAIPVGVGALAAAAVQHFKGSQTARPPFLLGVEPEAARCVLESLRAGRLVTVPGPHLSIMAGLNCGTPSQIAWPLLHSGLDAVVAVGDGWARRAVRALAAVGVTAGETGAAALAGLSAICQTAAGGQLRDAAALGPAASVLLLLTEGATDPQAWREIVGELAPTGKQPPGS
jgi:diaminopropionate ammonia-lyase